MNRLPTHRGSLRWLFGFALLLCLGAAQAESRFTYNENGTEVTDTLTGLTWRRCSEGQTYGGGTCDGSALLLTHEQALAYAATQSGWRLPNVKELGSLIDRSRSNPSINVLAFPATSTPSGWWWSSSPNSGLPEQAWFGNFKFGYVDSYFRNANMAVRLVR